MSRRMLSASARGESRVLDHHRALGVVVVAARIEVVGADHAHAIVDHQRLGVQADAHAGALQRHRLVGAPAGVAQRGVLARQCAAVAVAALHGAGVVAVAQCARVEGRGRGVLASGRSGGAGSGGLRSGDGQRGTGHAGTRHVGTMHVRTLHAGRPEVRLRRTGGGDVDRRVQREGLVLVDVEAELAQVAALVLVRQRVGDERVGRGQAVGGHHHPRRIRARVHRAEHVLRRAATAPGTGVCSSTSSRADSISPRSECDATAASPMAAPAPASCLPGRSEM